MLADGVWMRRQDCAFENCVWPMVLAREFCAVVNSQKKKKKTRKDAAVAAVQRKTNKRKREKAEKNKTVRRWIASAI